MPIVLANDGRRWACSLLTLNARGLFLGLFTAPSNPTPDNVLRDFVAPTYLGYAPQAFLAWGEVFLNLQGNAEADYDVVTFRVQSTSSPSTIYGYYVFNSLGYVLWSELNPAGPQVLQYAGDVYPVIPRLSVGALA